MIRDTSSVPWYLDTGTGILGLFETVIICYKYPVTWNRIFLVDVCENLIESDLNFTGATLFA
ncbi:MAG: hypothetical protein ACLTS6_17910 [Anaerobutyricum sp.]